MCLAVSPDGRYVATVARDPYRSVTSILVFHGASLEPHMRIETDTPAFARCAPGDGHHGTRARVGRTDNGCCGRSSCAPGGERAVRSCAVGARGGVLGCGDAKAVTTDPARAGQQCQGSAHGLAPLTSRRYALRPCAGWPSALTAPRCGRWRLPTAWTDTSCSRGSCCSRCAAWSRALARLLPHRCPSLAGGVGATARAPHDGAWRGRAWCVRERRCLARTASEARRERAAV